MSNKIEFKNVMYASFKALVDSEASEGLTYNIVATSGVRFVFAVFFEM